MTRAARRNWAGVVVLLLLGGVAAAVWRPAGNLPEEAAAAPEPGLGWAATVEAPSPAVPAAAPVVPSFDVVRVGPDGTAVVAGRAAPGAEVVVRDGDAEVARARAGSDGSFVALPAAPFAPGGRELTVAARADNGAEVKGDGSVLLVVPPPSFTGGGVAAAPAAALLVPGGAAPRVLQGGGQPDGARSGAPALSLDTVDYDDKGVIRFTGGAAVGGALRLYVDNGVVGDVEADGRGRWTLKPEAMMPPGLHALRVDELDASGQVVARVELPFERATMAEAALVRAGGRVVVQPGQNLWRLARAVYGQGVRYRVIYLANRDQIRDPRRIYPGQAFAVPKARGRAARG